MALIWVFIAASVCESLAVLLDYVSQAVRQPFQALLLLKQDIGYV